MVTYIERRWRNFNTLCLHLTRAFVYLERAFGSNIPNNAKNVFGLFSQTIRQTVRERANEADSEVARAEVLKCFAALGETRLSCFGTPLIAREPPFDD